MKFKYSKAFHKVCLMPKNLAHWPDRSQPFDPSKSEVVAWLVAQPEIQNYLFDKCHNSGAICFDSESQTWRGSAHR